MYFVMLVMHSANAHVSARAKGSSMKAAREGSIILRIERVQAERVAKLIERPAVYRDRNHRIS